MRGSRTLLFEEDASSKSESQWLERLLGRTKRWLQAVRELAGVWPDLPDADALRRELGDDAPREPL